MQDSFSQPAPNVTEVVSYTTVETSKSSTITNKKILRNTWTGNAVQINKYDTTGRLRSEETDHTSWQDHDHEDYEWTDKDTPPDIPPADGDMRVEPFGTHNTTSSHTSANGNTLMLKSTEISNTPVVHWSGVNQQHFVTDSQIPPVPSHANKPYANGPMASRQPGIVTSMTSSSAAPPPRQTEHNIVENVDGEKWSHCEETVWMTSNKRGTNPNVAIGNNYGGGPGGEAMKQIEGGMGNGKEDLSVEERRRLRRNAAREIAAKTLARDY